MSENLEQKRRKIDEIDEQIAKLLSSRFSLSKEIGKIKQTSESSVCVPERENEILKKVSAQSGEYAYQIRCIYKEIFIHSKGLQKITGLVGETIQKSLSPIIHEHFGDYNYRLFEVAPCAIDTFFKNPCFDGVNVTMPYKKLAMSYCDKLSDSAKLAGCVNVVIKENDGTLSGYNTDVFGFSYLLDSINAEIKGKKVLVIGNGGAACAIRVVLQNKKAKEIVSVSRSLDGGLEKIKDNLDSEYIINATPSKNLPIDIKSFTKLCGVVDITYGEESKLIKDSKEAKISSSDGLPMLVAQALGSHNLFINKNADCDICEIEKIIKIIK